jgi:hypothetical protein
MRVYTPANRNEDQSRNASFNEGSPPASFLPVLSSTAEFVVNVAKTSATKSKESESGKLRIGDDWNAIPTVALSQSNPLNGPRH